MGSLMSRSSSDSDLDSGREDSEEMVAGEKGGVGDGELSRLV